VAGLGYLFQRGPTIVISFDTAAGLTAGGQLKYKNVVMGLVKTITVSPDHPCVGDGGDSARTEPS
jgi:paraquat-inducible protein B